METTILTALTIAVMWGCAGYGAVLLSEMAETSHTSTRMRAVVFVLAPPICVVGLALLVVFLPIALAIAAALTLIHTVTARRTDSSSFRHTGT